MSTLIMFFYVILAAVIQAMLPFWGTMGQAKAPVLLAVLIYYSLNAGWGRTMAVGMLAGFLQDASSMMPFGFSAAVFCLVGWLLNRHRREMFIHHAVTLGVCGFAAGAAATVLLYMGLRMHGYVEFSAGWLMLKVFGSALLGMLVVPPVAWLARYLEVQLGTVAGVEV